MRNLLLLIGLLLFIATPCHAVLTTGYGAAAPAAGYCTSWTGTADADVLCEDFESTSSCATGHDSVCQATTPYTANHDGAGNDVDFTTSHSGTFACTDKGSNATGIIFATSGAGNESQFIFDKGATANDWYVQLYVNFTAESLANNEGAYIVAFSTNAAGADIAFGVRLIQDNSGNLKLQGMYYNGSTTTSDTGSAVVAVETWYGIRIKFLNNTASGFQWWVNYATNVWTDEGANNTGNKPPRYGIFGEITGAKIYSAQIDNIKIDDDTMPGDCTR